MASPASTLLAFFLFFLPFACSKPRFSQFYLHDIVTPTNFSSPTAVFSYLPTRKTKSFFGAIAVIDDKITARRDFHSQELGRARGYYVDNALDGQPTSLLFAFTAVFKNGSTLAFFGQDQIDQPQRILPVIGGTKDFELARGTAVFETVEQVGFNAILHVKVKLIYPREG